MKGEVGAVTVAGRVSVPTSECSGVGKKMFLPQSAQRAQRGREVGLTTKYTESTKEEERLIEDHSPYRVRGFQAWDNPLT